MAATKEFIDRGNRARALQEKQGREFQEATGLGYKALDPKRKITNPYE